MTDQTKELTERQQQQIAMIDGVQVPVLKRERDSKLIVPSDVKITHGSIVQIGEERFEATSVLKSMTGPTVAYLREAR